MCIRDRLIAVLPTYKTKFPTTDGRIGSVLTLNELTILISFFNLFVTDGEIQKKNSVVVDWAGLGKVLRSSRAGMSIHRAARTCGIHYTCINRRLKQPQMCFSPIQGNELKSRIIKFSKYGFGLTPKDVHRLHIFLSSKIKRKIIFSKVAGK